jgi:hypothetical protein
MIAWAAADPECPGEARLIAATERLEAVALDDFAAVARCLDERAAAWAACETLDLGMAREFYERGQRVLRRWRILRAKWAAEAAAQGQERHIWDAFTQG